MIEERLLRISRKDLEDMFSLIETSWVSFYQYIFPKKMFKSTVFNCVKCSVSLHESHS